MPIFHLIPVLLQHLWFARAGGGGSGDSGGGGGGSIIVLIGYVPMHLLGAQLRKGIGRHNEIVSVASQVIGWLISAIYAVVLVLIFHGIGVFMAVGALVGMGAGLYGWFGKLKQSKLVQQNLQQAAQNDAAWDETRLTDYAKELFIRYQADWAKQDIQSMQSYMTPAYFTKAALLTTALKQLHREDAVSDITIQNAVIVQAVDSPDNTEDNFTVGFTASADDILMDTSGTGKLLFHDTSPFTEYWHFKRAETTWLLNGITQATQNDYLINPQMAAFAADQDFQYSADMGWLLIPQRGQLFGEAKFGTSDINNHLIGLYKNELLVQIYTYTPNVGANKTYLIAQATLPKYYDDIVVRHRGKFPSFGIRGLERVETEWIDFNKKYEVFASRPEQVTSFELLNPTYMEQLEAVPFEVNLEVVDNVVYFYAQDRLVTVEEYDAMLAIVKRAYQEMKL